jgi:hypothetical protein
MSISAVKGFNKDCVVPPRKKLNNEGRILDQLQLEELLTATCRLKGIMEM